MKKIIFVCFCVCISWYASGQIKTIDSGSDIKYWYQDSFHDGKELGLEDLRKSVFKSYYRFSKDGQIVELWSNDNVTYNGILINYIYKLDRKHNEKIVFKKITLDALVTAKIINQFISDAICSIPSQDSIPKWETGLDGDTFEIEYSTPEMYSYKSYWEPDAQQSKEGIAINKFSIYLGKTLDLRAQYEAFRTTLPDGRYIIGISGMIKTSYKRPMKAKGGSSLFN